MSLVVNRSYMYVVRVPLTLTVQCHEFYNILLCYWSWVPLAHWYHWVIGIIGLLVQFGHWYCWVIGTIELLVSLSCWCTIGSLVLLCHALV